MILYSIVLLTIVSISLRITILGLEAAMFTIDRADDLRKVGETVVVQSTRLSKNKKIYRTARVVQFGVDTTARTGKFVIRQGKKATVFGIKQTLKLIRFVVSKLRDLLLALETVVLILDIVIFIILTAATAGYLVLYTTVSEEGELVYNEEVLGTLGSGGSSASSGNGESSDDSEDSEDSTSSDEFILECDNVDPNYHGESWEVQDRDLLELAVTREFGADYTGSVLVAQTIRDTMIRENTHRFEDIYVEYGYDAQLPDETLPDAVNAVKFVFDDGGSGVQHKMLCFYARNMMYSDWHEKQEFVVQYQNVRFFDFD